VRILDNCQEVSLNSGKTNRQSLSIGEYTPFLSTFPITLLITYVAQWEQNQFSTLHTMQDASRSIQIAIPVN